MTMQMTVDASSIGRSHALVNRIRILARIGWGAFLAWRAERQLHSFGHEMLKDIGVAPGGEAWAARNGRDNAQ
ncbi:MAG: hypothetical protein AB7I79_12345 [Rhizobiaceae bacterium]